MNTSMTDMINEGWAKHSDDPEAVVRQLTSDDTAGLLAADSYESATTWLKLFVHIKAGHQSDYEGTRQYLSGLPLTDEGARFARDENLAVIALCEGQSVGFDELKARGSAFKISNNIEAELTAKAAAELTHLDLSAAGVALFRRAIALTNPSEQTAQNALTAADPAARALAITANNLAGTLLGMEDLTAEQGKLMIEAATWARHYWAIAGTAVNVERAEYRLAKVHLKMKDYDQAILHAQLCDAICRDNSLDQIELFYASAALTEIYYARCKDLREQMTPENQGYCQLPFS